MAGGEVLRLLFPGRDGVALPHLCRQLQNPAERIHRAGPIRRRLRLSFPRHANCVNLDPAPGTKPESPLMVSLAEMPETASTMAATETTPPPKVETDSG